MQRFLLYQDGFRHADQNIRKILVEIHILTDTGIQISMNRYIGWSLVIALIGNLF